MKPALPSVLPRPHRAGVAAIVLGSLGFVVATLLVLNAFIPRDWQVRRSVLINAPIPTIHAIVSDLSLWPHWAQWNRQNLNPVNKLSATSVGRGATLHWKATPTTGGRGSHSKPVEGLVTIVRSDPLQGVWLTSTVAHSAPSSSAITYATRLGSTEVTWTDTGHLGQLLGGLSIDLFQQQLGAHMDKGLLLLKGRAERTALDPQ